VDLFFLVSDYVCPSVTFLFLDILVCHFLMFASFWPLNIFIVYSLHLQICFAKVRKMEMVMKDMKYFQNVLDIASASL